MDANDQTESFGARVRRLREKKQVTLRKFAEIVGKSPTYISMIERDEVKSPPTEEVIRAIAKALEQDEDEMLATMGKVSSDLTATIAKHPREMAAFLRVANSLSSESIRHMTEQAEKQAQIEKQAKAKKQAQA